MKSSGGVQWSLDVLQAKAKPVQRTDKESRAHSKT